MIAYHHISVPNVYEVDETDLLITAGEPIEAHFHRLNNTLHGFWEHTHFYLDKNYEVPWVQIEDYREDEEGEHFVNDEGMIHFRYVAREGQEVINEGTSYEYWIRPDGTVYCNTNEILDLKSAQHIFAICTTIIRDIYGDFDAEKAWSDYVDAVLACPL